MTEPQMHVTMDTARSLICFDMRSGTRAAVDAWATHMHAYFASIPEDTPVRILMDVSQDGNAFTPYFRAKATQFMQMYDRTGKMAFVFANQYIASVVMAFMALQKKRFIARGFVAYDKAYAWLTE